MKRYLSFKLLVVMGLFGLLLMACSDDKGSTSPEGNGNNGVNGNTDNTNIEVEPEDVTLLFLSDFSEEYFNENVKQPVEDEFPYITLDYIHGTSLDFEELIAEGTVPDLFRVENLLHLNTLEEFDMDFPLDDFIEKTNFDLSTIEPTLIEYIRNQHPEGKILALPYNRTIWGTFYNKDIFDIFGQEHPTDGMTWNEIIELAANLTGERNGISYRGLHLDIPSDAVSAYPVTYTDPETGESLIMNEQAFTNFFNMIDKMTSIPGNYPEGAEHFKTWGGAFMEGNVAMMPYWGPSFNLLEVDGLNWDVVTWPVWEDQPGVGPLANAHANAVSPHSDHKEAAFQVVSYLVSKEYQMITSRKGDPTSLIDPEVIEVFGEDIPGTEELNIQAFFDLAPSVGPKVISKYDQLVDGMWGKAGEFIESGDDVNTFIRKLHEEFNAQVEGGKAEKGWD